jgi:hypothetical protein
MVHYTRNLFLCAFLFLSVKSAHAQVFLLPKPDYPFQARKMHLQGSGAVTVTFSNYFQPPTKVEIAKSMGNSVLDFAMVDWARKKWVVVNFTAEERRNPGLMDAKLRPYISDANRRKESVERMASSKPRSFSLPVTKTIPMVFLLRP